MIITKQVKKEIEVDEIQNIICNRCGESCKDNSPEWTEYCGLIEAKVEGRYSSPLISDETSYKFSLCEKCLLELFTTFKIAPEIKEPYIPDYDYATEE